METKESTTKLCQKYKTKGKKAKLIENNGNWSRRREINLWKHKIKKGKPNWQAFHTERYGNNPVRLRDSLSNLCPGGKLLSILTAAIFTGSPDVKIENYIAEIEEFVTAKSDTR